MARLGMTHLISTLRQLTNATTTDATIGAETYFSDDHLQLILDSTRQTWQRIPLTIRPEHTALGPVYKLYEIPHYVPRAFEQDAADSGWAVRDALGALIGTDNYAANYQSGLVTFYADTEGLAHVLYCRTYDMNRAASNIWLQKASFAFSDVDWGSDNHRLQASQQFEHCLHMAEAYAARSGASIAKMVRADEQVRTD